ncbi:MAG: hypothetical protein DSZ33_01555, partial [Gammaproteobacteria bacterium]
DFFLLSSKKSIFACNVSEGDLADALKNPDDHPMVAQVRKYAAETQGAEATILSAQIEEELSELSPEDATEFLQEMGVSDSGASNLIKSVYNLLGLRTYLTTGVQETRAWTIFAGDKAPAAAGVIHTDFEKQFIRAEVIHYDDYVKYKTVAAAREGNPKLKEFDTSCFDGRYITGTVNEAYLHDIGEARNDKAKQQRSEEHQELALDHG